MTAERIVRVALGVEREALAAPFGFKGGTLTQLWQVAVTLETASGLTGTGVGVQSVLWSDPVTFLAHDEAGGNACMLDVTRGALTRLKNASFTTPPEMLRRLFPGLLADARHTLGRADVPATFVLNALVAVDFALWQIWCRQHGTGFDGLMARFCPTAGAHETQLASIPLVGYHTTLAEADRLCRNGTGLLKIKLGADPDGRNDPETMLRWDIERLRALHEIAGSVSTPLTDSGHPAYYLDANGRYPDKALLMRLLAAADAMGALERVLLLEEPFAQEAEFSVSDLPVRAAADERAHSAQDVRRLTRELGYTAIALKPIAKTLSETLEMIGAAREAGAACFCADLTVPPVMLDWNLALAARLPRLPGMRIGVVESNGPQNYADWDRLRTRCSRPEGAWRTPQGGVFSLKDGPGDVFLMPPERYARMTTTL